MKASKPAPAEKIQNKSVQRSTQLYAQTLAGFVDARPEVAAQLQLQEMANNSLQTRQLKSLAQMTISNPTLTARATQHAGVMQLVEKQGPDDQGMIEVEELDDYLPNCLGNDVESRRFYRRSSGITNGWNDQDLFYADGDDGALVQVTVAMVNAYWDPKYDGFAKLSGPDWTKNCEDYAQTDGFGDEVGDYDSAETLSPLIQDNGSYVLKLGYHWMRVIKTGEDAITIQQKDGESAVYSKNFNLANALNYIIEKRGFGGTVYRG